MPQRKNRAAHSFPCQVLGVASPYPTVVRVTCEINITNTTFRSRFCFCGMQNNQGRGKCSALADNTY